jgi:Sugar-transfer associated ATP-grasp
LCLTAATAYPGLRLQNWDIAIGDRGPVILEVNVEGSMDLHQLAGGRGILDGALAAALDDMGAHHRGINR